MKCQYCDKTGEKYLVPIMLGKPYSGSKIMICHICFSMFFKEGGRL